MVNKTGYFVISLDFELMWGVRDNVTKQTYGQHILGVQTVIPKLLSCFHKYQINATFATVGFLFIKDKNELFSSLPATLPNYKELRLSPYGSYLEQEIGTNDLDDKYHYGLPLLQLIQQSPGQEIATHTFSHYYCLEEGQTIEDFKNDLQSALHISKRRNINIESIIFPRNQVNQSYLKICSDAGITCYRDNEKSWIYDARNSKNERYYRRLIRIMDAYLNLSGHHCYSSQYMSRSIPYNIASSRFLRPYSKRLKWLEWLRLKRITNSMTHAAKNNLTYHLWWHPHNFGINQDENFAFLEKVLKHYQELNVKYSFTSITMKDLSKELSDAKNK